MRNLQFYVSSKRPIDTYPGYAYKIISSHCYLRQIDFRRDITYSPADTSPMSHKPHSHIFSPNNIQRFPLLRWGDIRGAFYLFKTPTTVSPFRFLGNIVIFELGYVIRLSTFMISVWAWKSALNSVVGICPFYIVNLQSLSCNKSVVT